MGLRVVYNATYRNEVIQVAGHHFEKCFFERCQLEYDGIEEVAFSNCTLRDVNWSFVGPAANTINFLSALYNGFGDLGKQVTEQFFESIRTTRQIHAYDSGQVHDQAEAHIQKMTFHP